MSGNSLAIKHENATDGDILAATEYASKRLAIGERIITESIKKRRIDENDDNFKEYYGKEKVSKDCERVERRSRARAENSHNKYGDNIEKIMETDDKITGVIDYMINRQELITNRRVASIIPSKYDKEVNHSSLIMAMEKKDGGTSLINLDITSYDKVSNVDGMFQCTPGGCTDEITYFKYGKTYAKLNNIPRYVVGISRKNADAAVSKFQISETTKPDQSVTTEIMHSGDDQTRFKVLSEIYEQAKSRRESVKNGNASTKTQLISDKNIAVYTVIKNELAAMLGVDLASSFGNNFIQFEKKFDEEYEKACKTITNDEVYSMIIARTRNLRYGVKTAGAIPAKDLIGTSLSMFSKKPQ